MSKFEKQKIEQSINYFKENIEICYEKISSLEKEKIWNIDFYDWNKEINSKIKLQNNIIEYFHEKISQSNELLLNTKKEPVFSKKIINSIDNKIEKTKSIKTTKERKIKTEIFL